MKGAKGTLSYLRGQGGLEIPPVGFICRTYFWRNRLILKCAGQSLLGLTLVTHRWDIPQGWIILTFFSNSVLSGLMGLMNLPKVPGGFLSGIPWCSCWQACFYILPGSETPSALNVQFPLTEKVKGTFIQLTRV